MTLPLSGNSISLSNIAVEFSDSSPYRLSEFYRGGNLVPAGATPNIPTSGVIRFSNFYGAAVTGRSKVIVELTGSIIAYDVSWANGAASNISYANGSTDVTINIQANTMVYSTSPTMSSNAPPASGAAFIIPSSFIAPGNKVTLNVHGIIIGSGGPGGASSGFSSPAPGNRGSDAMYVGPVPSPGPSKVVDVNIFPTGFILGGGGGGGQGSPRFYSVPGPPKAGPQPRYVGGGAGGGGVGYIVGLGGPTTSFPGGTGPAGSPANALPLPVASWPRTPQFSLTPGAGGPGVPNPSGIPSGAGGTGGSVSVLVGNAGAPSSYTGGGGGAAGNSIFGVQQVALPIPGSPNRLFGPTKNS